MACSRAALFRAIGPRLARRSPTRGAPPRVSSAKPSITTSSWSRRCAPSPRCARSPSRRSRSPGRLLRARTSSPWSAPAGARNGPNPRPPPLWRYRSPILPRSKRRSPRAPRRASAIRRWLWRISTARSGDRARRLRLARERRRSGGFARLAVDLADERGNAAARDRWTEQEALRLRAAALAQKVELALRLDAFGGCGDAEIAG